MNEVTQEDYGGHSGDGQHEEECERVVRCRSEHKKSDDRRIICCNKKCQGDTRLYRICKIDRAAYFISATRYFQFDVYSRTSTLQDKRSVFAAGVMYHSQFMNAYLLKYTRCIEDLSAADRQAVTVAFQNVLEKVEFPKKGYKLSDLCYFMNAEIQPTDSVNNKQLKHPVIQHFGEKIMISYPN
jgi:hypothetical protein